ncbi:MAG: hypothetical protein ACFFG0_32085 [Candidatus Thorarchaeota archaeon]
MSEKRTEQLKSREILYSIISIGEFDSFITMIGKKFWYFGKSYLNPLSGSESFEESKGKITTKKIILSGSEIIMTKI